MARSFAANAGKFNDANARVSDPNRLERNAFARQQFPLPIQSAGKSAGLFVRGKDSVARHQHRNGIRPARAAHGADGFGLTNRRRDFAVAFRFAGRNFQ